MKLRNILITVVAAGMMFASADRAGVVGYTEGDYTDMNTFAHKAAGLNVAHTMGTDFTAVWSADGSTWGFSSGDEADLVNMRWSNGTYGLSVGLNMDSGVIGVAAVAPTQSEPGTSTCDNPETLAVEDDFDCGDAVEYAPGSDAVLAVDAATTFNLGFGMNLFGWDVGFGMNTADDGPMTLNARGKCGFWAFDTFTFGYTSDTNDAGADYTSMDLGMYGVHEWGAATGMFGMGITMNDDASMWHGGEMTINTGFSVESTLTDWCDLRIGYNKSFNMATEDGGQESDDSYSAGLGFNYGSVGLDMTISSGTLSNMVSNPLEYINGRNDDALAASWTLSYTW